MLVFYKWLGLRTRSIQTSIFTLQIRSYSRWLQVPTIEYSQGDQKKIGFYNRKSIIEQEVFNRMMTGESIRIQGTRKDRNN